MNQVIKYILPILLLILCFGNLSFAQNKFRQNEEGVQQMLSFFERSQICFKAQHVYLFLLPPMRCPRCEGLIGPISRQLKQLGDTADILLLAFYPKQNALESYLATKNFQVDHLITFNDEKLLSAFEWEGPALSIPFIAKFDLLKGRLLASQALLGITVNEQMVNNLMEANDPLPLLPSSKGSRLEEPLIQTKQLPLKKLILLEENSLHPVSAVLDPILSNDLSMLLFTDDLTLYKYLFDLEKGRFVRVFRPSITEQRIFVDSTVGDELYDYLLNNNVLQSMYFSAGFGTRNNIHILASLPKLFWEAPEELAYENELALVTKDLISDSVYILALESHPLENMILDHTNALFLADKNRIYIPTKKGWPVVAGGQGLDSSDRANNPFDAEFYETAPLWAVFDLQGHYKFSIGDLDPELHEFSLGYTYVEPVLSEWMDKLYGASGYTGKIQCYDQLGQVTNEWKVFPWPIHRIHKEPDPFKYLRSYNKALNKTIRGIQMKAEGLYFIVNSREGYELFLVNETQESLGYFPAKLKDAKLRFAALSRQVPFAIYQSSSLTYLAIF